MNVGRQKGLRLVLRETGSAVTVHGSLERGGMSIVLEVPHPVHRLAHSIAAPFGLLGRENAACSLVSDEGVLLVLRRDVLGELGLVFRVGGNLWPGVRRSLAHWSRR